MLLTLTKTLISGKNAFEIQEPWLSCCFYRGCGLCFKFYGPVRLVGCIYGTGAGTTGMFNFSKCLLLFSEDEEFVSSFITSRSEKQLVQQLKRSLMSTKNYSDITVSSVRKVKQLRQINAANISLSFLQVIMPDGL